MKQAIAFLEASIENIDLAMTNDADELSRLNARRDTLINDMAQTSETRVDLFATVEHLKSLDKGVEQ